MTLIALALIFSLAIVGLSLYSIVTILQGHWVWGPSWLPWVAVGAIGLPTVTFIGISVMEAPLGAAFTAIFIQRAIIAFIIADIFGDILAFLTILIPGLSLLGLIVFYAAVAIREYWGWFAAAGIIAIPTIALGLVWLLVKRRNDALANPLRGLLEVDERAARSRTSIIA
jgi:hypothetical protein